jgi:hypothetical protein
VRPILQPTRTSFRVEFGEQWDSNPLDSSVEDASAYTTFVNGTWLDERRFGARRWRTLANFQVEVTPAIDELNYGYLVDRPDHRSDAVIRRDPHDRLCGVESRQRLLLG